MRSWGNRWSGRQPPRRPCLILRRQQSCPSPNGVADCALFPVRPINTCQFPLWGAHTAFVFLRGQPPDNRDKWWRQFWRSVSDYQPVLMRAARWAATMSSDMWSPFLERFGAAQSFICGRNYRVTTTRHPCRSDARPDVPPRWLQESLRHEETQENNPGIGASARQISWTRKGCGCALVASGETFSVNANIGAYIRYLNRARQGCHTGSWLCNRPYPVHQSRI
jgi:hypothetical protein